MAKIKIIENVSFNGHILKKDSVHDLPGKAANILVDGEHAVPHEERQQQQQQQPQQSPPAPPAPPEE